MSNKMKKTQLVCISMIPLSLLAAGITIPTFISEGHAVNVLRPLADIKKLEFEKTEHFNKRVCDKVHELLKSKKDTVYDFPVFSAIPVYDADKGKFLFNVRNGFPSVYNNSFGAHRGIVIGEKERSRSGYVGQNRYGAAASVESISSDVAMLIIPEKNKKMQHKEISIGLTISPLEASKIKNDLRLVVSTPLVGKCFATGHNYDRPTLSEPQEHSETLLGLIGVSNAKWKVIRNSTGNVLKSGQF